MTEEKFLGNSKIVHRSFPVISIPCMTCYHLVVKLVRNLEEELLLVASHYLEKMSSQVSSLSDVEARNASEVDRFAVTLDLWTCEKHFLEHKRKLVDCFFEIYQHVYVPLGRRKIAQVPQYTANFQKGFLKPVYMSCMAPPELPQSLLLWKFNAIWGLENCCMYFLFGGFVLFTVQKVVACTYFPFRCLMSLRNGV